MQLVSTFVAKFCTFCLSSLKKLGESWTRYVNRKTSSAYGRTCGTPIHLIGGRYSRGLVEKKSSSSAILKLSDLHVGRSNNHTLVKTDAVEVMLVAVFTNRCYMRLIQHRHKGSHKCDSRHVDTRPTTSRCQYTAGCKAVLDLIHHRSGCPQSDLISCTHNTCCALQFSVV